MSFTWTQTDLAAALSTAPPVLSPVSRVTVSASWSRVRGIEAWGQKYFYG